MSLKQEFAKKITELKALAAKIKLGGIPPATPPGDGGAATSYTCGDGTIIQIEGGLATGSKVMIVGADGTPTAAPSNDYTLEDGTVITVDNGVISNVTPGTEMADETKLSEETKKAITDAVNAAIGTFKSENEALKAEVTALKTSMATQKTEFATALEATVALVEEIAAEPAAEPVQNPKSNFKAQKESAIDRLSESMAKLKKEKES